MAKTATRDEWLKARRDLLLREKEFSNARDALSAARRALPRVRIAQNYIFNTPSGEQSLLDLFGENSQLILQHFMFGPDWSEGCPICSFWADGYNSTLPHLDARGISFVAVSRAPMEKLEAYKARMGWDFSWVSSDISEFNFDFGVSFREGVNAGGQPNYNFGTIQVGPGESPGISVFERSEDGEVYHTYSAYSRGLDMLNPAYQLIDLTPRGRNETGPGMPMSWVRRHDQYGA